MGGVAEEKDKRERLGERDVCVVKEANKMKKNENMIK